MTRAIEPGQSCYDCTFYQYGAPLGECHRHAPATRQVMVGDGTGSLPETFWPTVESFEWCGEWVQVGPERAAERDKLDALFFPEAYEHLEREA